MAKSQPPKIYAGMLKRELQEVADRLGLRGVKKLRKEELIKSIQNALRRPKTRLEKSTAQQASDSVAPRDTKPAKKKSMLQKAREKLGEKAAQAAEKASQVADQQERVEPNEAPAEAGEEKTAEAEPSPRPESSGPISNQSQVTAAKYRVGNPFPEEELRQVDLHLPGLPDGYGEDRLVLLPRDPQWLFAYWDLKNETKDVAREKGGKNLSLRLFEVHDNEFEPMAEHWCQELSRSWYVQAPSPGQVYVTEIGYRAVDGSWLSLLRSNSVKVPPASPSHVVADEFVTLRPDQPLLGTVEPGESSSPEVGSTTRPTDAVEEGTTEIGDSHGEGSAVAPSPSAEPEAGSDRDAGTPHEDAYQASVGSVETVAPGSLGMAGPGGPSSPGGVSSPQSSSFSLTSSAMAHVGTQSSNRASEDEQGFWLVAEAELVVFGATEPNAKVLVGGQRVRLRSDGTFSARMAFPDGEISVPIEATNAEGTETRKIKLVFSRSTTEEGSPQ